MPIHKRGRSDNLFPGIGSSFPRPRFGSARSGTQWVSLGMASFQSSLTFDAHSFSRRRAIVGLLSIATHARLAQAKPTSVLTNAARQALQAWLDSETQGRFQIAKIRQMELPAGGSWCELDVAFNGTEPEFAELLHTAPVRGGGALPERLLAKFAITARKSPGDVHVDIIVGETDYATYVGQHGQLVMLEASVLKQATVSAPLDLKAMIRSPSIEVATLTEQDLDRVAQSIRDKLVAGLRARHPGPQVHVVTSAISGGAFSIQVDALKDEALHSEGWWESLEVACFLSVISTKAKLHCCVDGRYGAGAGKHPPTEYQDMEPKYTKQLQQYAASLLAAAQQATGAL